MNCSCRVLLQLLLATGSLFALAVVASAEEPSVLQHTLEDVDVGDRWYYNDWESAKAAAQVSKKPILALFR